MKLSGATGLEAALVVVVGGATEVVTQVQHVAELDLTANVEAGPPALDMKNLPSWPAVPPEDCRLERVSASASISATMARASSAVIAESATAVPASVARDQGQALGQTHDETLLKFFAGAGLWPSGRNSGFHDSGPTQP